MQVMLALSTGDTRVWTYCATAIDPTLRPYTWYKALVLAGARERGLPGDYIERMQQVPACDDADTERARLHWAMTWSDTSPTL
jgi:hypothetical protein